MVEKYYIKRPFNMKKIILNLFFLSSLYGETFDQNATRTCSEISDEINVLEKQKLENSTSRFAAFLFGGIYAYGLSNDDIDMKIRLLKLELSDCR